MLVSAVALAVVCAASFVILPMLWWPRRSVQVAPSALSRPSVVASVRAESNPHQAHVLSYETRRAA